MTSNEWLILHGKYERKALRIILNHVRSQLLKIPLENIDEYNAGLIVSFNVDKGFANAMLRDLYMEIGLKHGDLILKEIDKFKVKRHDKPFFSQAFANLVTQYLETQGLRKVVTIEQTLISDVTNFIINQLRNGKTIREISRLIASPKLYKWQSMRIARTETTFAASLASEQASELGSIALQKKWISADDVRSRPTHSNLNGKIVEKDEYFKIGNINMKYPGDPNAPAEELVNCRCSIVYIPKKNDEGGYIPKG